MRNSHFANLLLISSLLIFACKPSGNNKETDGSTSFVDDTISSLYNDSLILTKRAIVFYQLKDEQIDSMLSVEPDGGIADANSDFVYYSGLATDSLRRDSIDVIYTNKRFISCKMGNNPPFILDREKNKYYFGMLITNGNTAPLIVNGVKTEQEYMSEALPYIKK